MARPPERLTERLLDALEIVARYEPVRGSQFARLFWPDKHREWERRCGSRYDPSGRLGGRILARLWRLRLVAMTTDFDGYALTAEGRRVLAEKRPKQAAAKGDQRT